MNTVAIVRNLDVLAYLFSYIIKEDGFICGGYARYCCSPNKVPIISEDIDIYCPTDEAYERIKTRMSAEGYSIQFTSEVADTYRYCCTGRMPLQLIKPRIQGAIVARGAVEDILGAFDFTIARCAIFLDRTDASEIAVGSLNAVADDNFLEDETHRRLVIKNIHCPIAQVYRISKYLEKGFNITVLEVIKVLEDWEGRSPEYKKNIHDTLVKDNPSQFEIQELEKLLHWD